MTQSAVQLRADQHLCDSLHDTQAQAFTCSYQTMLECQRDFLQVCTLNKSLPMLINFPPDRVYNLWDTTLSRLLNN